MPSGPADRSTLYEEETRRQIPFEPAEEPGYFSEPPGPAPRPRGNCPHRGGAWEIAAVEAPRKSRIKKDKRPKQRKAKRKGLFSFWGGKSRQEPEPDAFSSEHTEPDASTPAKKKRRPFWAKKEKVPEVPPLDFGATTVPDLLAPASADFTSREYAEVDGKYFAYLYIAGYGYATIVGNGWLNPIIEAGEDINVSFFVRRQAKDKILSSIAKTTMINRSRMRDVEDTRQDYEEIDSAISSGLYLKEGINRGGEDFYYMNTLIEVAADDPDQLEQRVSELETLCTSLDVVCRRCDYKHEQGFLSSLPLLALDPDIERKSRRNALTTGVAAAFPFSSFELCDQNGIMLGINLHNRSVCMIDIFDATKYANANFCVCGMSGAGKTFLLQLIAMRLRQQGVKVMIVAPVKGFEFRPACEAIGGKYIKLAPASEDCVGWLEIRRRSLDIDARLGRDRGDSLIADKIAKTHILFGLLKPDITMQERNLLDDAVTECYARQGFTHDNGSLFEEDGKAFRVMPTLTDLYDVLEEKEETRGLALSMRRLAKWLGGGTNVDLSNDYIVFDISEVGKDLLPVVELIVTDLCRDECMADRIRKKVIIIDELWSIIGAGSNSDAADFILELFKTIRGLGGSCIGATQDLHDFFALENGKYGKGIINNSRIKVILPLEEEEAVRVKDVLGLSDEETMQVIRNKSGEGLLCAGHNRISVAFQSTRAEYDAITTRRSDLEAQLKRMETADSAGW